MGFRRNKTWTRKELRRQVEAERIASGADLAVELIKAQLARPKIRAHCVDGPRPCPFVSCRHHLAFEVTAAGGLKANHPETDLDDLADTCALDVADRGGVTLEEVGRRLNVTRERIRQEETKALRRLQRLGEWTREGMLTE